MFSTMRCFQHCGIVRVILILGLSIIKGFPLPRSPKSLIRLNRRGLRFNGRWRHRRRRPESVIDQVNDKDPHDAWSRRGFLAAGNLLALLLAGGRKCACSVDSWSDEDEANWSRRSGSSSTESRAFWPSSISVVPFSSVRRYKLVTLSNGLPVLLVSDRSATTLASAALSINGAGQFSDPDDLPGLAHLMEHMILSFNSKTTFKRSRDFDDWLADHEGASNGFTAYQSVCFHFACTSGVLAEALKRFAGLFTQEAIESVCRDATTLKREIARVNSELDLDDVATQASYLTRAFVNLEHPYSRFSAGSLDTLERLPQGVGIDVAGRLIEFFQQYYRPREAVLVVIGPLDLFSLERMVMPFSFAFSRRIGPLVTRDWRGQPLTYPGGFLRGNRYKHLILYRKKGDPTTEKISFEWALNLDYREFKQPGKSAITISGAAVAFVLAQIFGRRGPGSLHAFLLRRGWGQSALPRITVPIDVSGFQIIRLEIGITLDGFLNRFAVVAAVYDAIEALRAGDSFALPRQLIAQFASTAKLHSYQLVSRPPDAVELAMDAQLYGLELSDRVGSGQWFRFPNDPPGLLALQKVTSIALEIMSDPANAVIIVTAGIVALTESGRLGDKVPPVSSGRWLTEPIAAGYFYFEDLLRLASRAESLVLRKIVDREELSSPVLNPLVPIVLRPPRVVTQPLPFANSNEKVVFLTARDNVRANDFAFGVNSGATAIDGSSNGDWRILEPTWGQVGLPLPSEPPESTCRCALVLQLLSSRPARADVRQTARAELWRVSFDRAATDLAELGAPGGLAYDLSFNKYGLRLAFLGISQTLPSYSRRLTRRLGQHHRDLLEGPKFFPKAITAAAVFDANRPSHLSPQRRRRIISNVRSSSAYEAAAEGKAFLRSCSGAVCFAEGDLLQKEVGDLLQDLRLILQPSMAAAHRNRGTAATPSIDDLIYKPVWKPRKGSSCSVVGMPLISDACGRLPR